MSTSVAEHSVPLPAGPGLTLPADPPIDLRGDEPIRADLFGMDYLEAHARRLAAGCVPLSTAKSNSPLLRRFAENGKVLVQAHRRILEDPTRRETRGLDAEWLADNFHIAEDVLREVRKDLPSGYDSELPKLVAGPLAGYPRVYALALGLVARSDSALDEARITRYVRAFQTVAPLTIGELWAVPTMLRLVLLENLRRLAAQMTTGWDERQEADTWGNLQLVEASGRPASAFPSLADSFVVRLLQVVRDGGPKGADLLGRLEAKLAEAGRNLDDVLRREHRRQAANQVTVGNCVTSLRLLSALDWNDFFERHNPVDAALRDDPAGIYARQDFPTRDRQRRKVEDIARRSGADEVAVARRAVELAGGLDGPRGHVGYYLIDRGMARLKAEFGYKAPWRDRLLTFSLGHPGSVYFGSILLVMGLILAALLALAGGTGLLVESWRVPLLLLALLLPISELAVGLVNHLLTIFMPPRTLPKLDFKDGIAEDCATFVAMPSMLVRRESAAVLLERLEIHFLANPDPALRFALLTDFADAPGPHMPEDDDFVQSALDGVRELNERYGVDGGDKFFLFHRKRLCNPAQGCWMGWERKRGKLSEFNRLLQGAGDTSYAVVSGDLGRLPAIRFVITLDADTQLPRDSAAKLVGAIAHPLVRPRYDPAARRVVEGHAVLQPRVSYHMLAATRSRFAAILAASAGIDPYATAVSDTYMDLFGSGSFTGKGIYDVAAFEAATGRTFPDDRILSHDLIEGNYARCGLITDVELFDDFPPRYHAFARREHRWVRGDWQLLPWLGRTVPTPDGPKPNPLPTLERWKLGDNLRRSLVPPALLLLLLLGWTVLPGSPLLWTLVALAIPALPLLQLVIGTAIGAVRSGSPAGALKGLGGALLATAGHVLMTTAFLADQARLLVDATARTLYRLFGSRKHMLEWETAASTERRLGTGMTQFWLTMWPAAAIALAFGVVVGLANPGALRVAAPVLAAWVLSPVAAFWLSRPRPSEDVPLTDDDRAELGKVARRTWHFFETFVGDEDHWLPPDNYQVEPGDRVAHRTSPTNKGLLLLSTLSAHDLGYIGLRTLADRLGKTFDTLDNLERYQGHFINWYNTRTLKALPPSYISTVDSGNMLGCLITLKHGLREKLRAPLLGPEARRGLGDALALAAEALRARKPAGAGSAEAARGVEGAIAEVRRLLAESPADLLAWDEWFGRLDWAAVALIGRLRALADAADAPPETAELWARRLLATVHERRAELAALAPWLEPLRGVPADLADAPADARRHWRGLHDFLIAPGGIADIADRAWTNRGDLEALAVEHPGLRAVAEAVDGSTAAGLRDRILRLADRAEDLAEAMDFRFLYKPDRHLFSIGCNLVQGRLDASCYDLLASESALTSFLCVARGQVPRKHWFQLGRQFIDAAGEVGLLSWGGTMFEYLMPRLMMKSLPATLVTRAARVAVARQIEYGRQQGIPWGISESAFSAQYVDGDYQYQAFGVPGLGLKRGLERDLVVAPYATALAVMVRPHEVIENFRRLAAEGGLGPYGFYEAIDYTPGRVPAGQKSIVCRSYMAHHQGMSLVAITNALLDDPMPRRFHAEPTVRAVELLLQERIPRDPTIISPTESETAPARTADDREAGGTPLLSRRMTTPATPAPRTILLSNSLYSVMLTNSGAGYSTCRGLDVTRWREDATRDHWGQFLYVHDLTAHLVWSAGHQPTGRTADDFEAVFSADKAAFRRLDAGIETLLEVTVSAENLAEVRRVTLTNRNPQPRELELTSYAEVVLTPRAADLAHPAFGKLFLETEWVPESAALLCRRRPRSPEEKPVWAVHVSAADGPGVAGEIQHETDRARFLGRGRGAADPAAMDPGSALSGTTGPVLDPILSLRRRVKLEPGASAVVAFTTAVADGRAEALALADQFREPAAVSRAFELAWAHSQVEHRHRPWSAEEGHLYQRLAAHILFAQSALRAAPAVLNSNRQGQPGLWKFGISGDRPIVLVRIAESGELPLARQLLDAHAYLRHKGLEFDLVLLDEEPAGYVDQLHKEFLDLVRNNEMIDKPGGLYVRRALHLPEEDQWLLQSAARAIFVGDRGPLANQLDRIDRLPIPPPALVTAPGPAEHQDGSVVPPPDLLFPNGLGGFAPDGREYCIFVRTAPEPDVRRNGKASAGPASRLALPPAPWINVVANPACGFLASEAGLGYTWVGNSQSNRLTPWSNDPVSDPPAESIYVRDEETGEVWTTTPLPIPAHADTVVRHGQGYTVYERLGHGLAHELTVFVPPEDPVKILRLKLTNVGDRPRHLSATYYADWVLGATRDAAPMAVVTEVDHETGALLARNSFNVDFGDHVAFADVDRRPRTLTADRVEFLGRNGSTAAPAGLGRVELSNRAGAGLDPCVAIQAKLDLHPGEEIAVSFLLGQAPDLDTARELSRRYRDAVAVQAALDDVRRRWDDVLTAVQVRTPDPALDLLVNRWLPYQVLSCRVWGRSAFYQSGGAYGFRDQLQDAMALVYGAPAEARAQILRAAGRQFVEGDVQHWWHPPAGRGVRTRISDDLLWLPFVACHYVATTGDRAILDERLPYLSGPVLKAGQEDDFGLPVASDRVGTVYDHCIRALDQAHQLGVHGLPLMGTGDWNDGMNRVGSGGRGESVWDAWFQIAILRQFAPLAEARGDAPRALACTERAEVLHAAVERNAWDGSWYRRAYFDDGTPLGSTQNEECRIDSIAQSWAVISGVADLDRARRAMAAVEEHLVRADDRLILLFTPPFDRGPLEPGYVKGYVPGIRENGGQYTHAATWVVQATAQLGQGRRAWELFDLLNPIRHAADPDAVALYKVEPYVLAADVYGRPPHAGRGGWTWYTGSAGWLYRVALETLLGFRLLGDRLALDPCIPGAWPRFEITYRRGPTAYHILVENPEGVERGVREVFLDDQPCAGDSLPLTNDGREHRVRVLLGPRD